VFIRVHLGLKIRTKSALIRLPFDLSAVASAKAEALAKEGAIGGKKSA
jgi:hypothetical protein